MRFTCQRCVELITEYLDRALGENLTREIDQHLSGCPLCVNFVSTYRSAPEAVRKKLLAEDMPPEMKDSLTAFLKGKVPGF